MAIKVFILGRPGSGKSTAFRHIVKYLEQQDQLWSAIRFNDYEILQEMFRFEELFRHDAANRQFRATKHAGFDVLDFSVLDIALKELEKQVQRVYSMKDGLIIIEFARDNYDKALSLFRPNFLQNSYFLFIDADMETCMQRVHDRVAHPKTEDDTFVSEDILRSYYHKQSIPSNLKSYGIDSSGVKVVNSRGSEYSFAKKVNQFVDDIIKQETLILTSRSSSWNWAEKGRPIVDAILRTVIGVSPTSTSRR